MDEWNLQIHRNHACNTGMYKYRRREAKSVTKQEAVLKQYFELKMKPRDIRKELKVPIDFVYKTVETFKKAVQQLNNELLSKHQLRGTYPE